jgi:8-oxo-dGTP pyrophosphatase MutT (NUDIX family)
MDYQALELGFKKELIKLATLKPYRPRVEVFPVRDGKVLGGLYPDGSFRALGGGIENNETPEEAGVREVMEESGYKVTGLKPLPVRSLKEIWSDEEVKKLTPGRGEIFKGHKTQFLTGLVKEKERAARQADKVPHLNFYGLDKIIDKTTSALGKSSPYELPIRKRLQALRELKKLHG